MYGWELVGFRDGFLGLIEDVDRSLAALDEERDPRAYDKALELRAMRQCAEALIRFAARYAARASGPSTSYGGATRAGVGRV